MRTTVRIDDRLLREAKRYAVQHGRTFTCVLEDSLRQFLGNSARRKGVEPFRMVTFKGDGWNGYAAGYGRHVESRGPTGSSSTPEFDDFGVIGWVKRAAFPVRSDRTRRSAWTIFSGLCRTVSVKGGLVTDAYFAALAIESGSEWITTDRDYSRFPGLRWRHPIKS